MAAKSRLFSRREMHTINYCRLYVHATTISELFNASGTEILTDMFYCRRPTWFDTRVYITLQRRPSSYQIKYCWQRLLRQLCTATGSIAESDNLGHFIIPGQGLRLRRQTYMDTRTTSTVYHWHETQYWKYKSTTVPGTYTAQCPVRWDDMEYIYPIDVTAQPNPRTLIIPCSALRFPSPTNYSTIHQRLLFLVTPVGT